MKSFPYILIGFSLLIVACMPSWSYISNEKLLINKSYYIQFPSGWKKMRLDDRTLITPENPDFAIIGCETYPGKQTFEFTKKKFHKSMLPEEAAELVVDNFSLNPSNQNFKLISNEPAEINGKDGFMLHFEHKSPDGVPVSTLIVGFISDEKLNIIQYEALKRVYFDKFKPQFESAIKSLQIKSNSSDKKE